MAHEFPESEMYPCDICGAYLPVEEMYQLPDGRIVCEGCLEESIEESEVHYDQ